VVVRGATVVAPPEGVEALDWEAEAPAPGFRCILREVKMD
jgi:hypothetical protein